MILIIFPNPVHFCRYVDVIIFYFGFGGTDMVRRRSDGIVGGWWR